MNKEILDDFKHLDPKGLPISNEEVQKKLKWFCFYIAFSCLVVNFVLNAVLLFFDYLPSSQSFQAIIIGFPYALMFIVSATIDSLKLYPKKQRNIIINSRLVLKITLTSLGWSILSPLAGFLGFLTSMPIALTLSWLLVDFKPTTLPSSTEFILIVLITYIITHAIWGIWGYLQLKP